MLINDSDILIQSEDRPCQQERLRHVVEQPACHVVDLDHLIGHERDTAHDEQYRTGVLRDFEPFVFFLPLHHGRSCPSEKQGDDVTNNLKNGSYFFVHDTNLLSSR